MARLIDVDELKKDFRLNFGGVSHAVAACEIIDRQPTIKSDGLSSESWISVEDKLPSYNQPVIICRPYGKDCLKVEQGCRDLGDWWRVYGTRTKRVTHWMPLPEPPEEDCLFSGRATGNYHRMPLPEPPKED